MSSLLYRSVARRNAAREVELSHRAIGAVADRLVEAVLLGIEAEKGAPARLEAVGFGATFDAPQHCGEANQFRRPPTNQVFAASGKFRSRAVP
jgi:type IV pilus biogenesis protein CpaD/CtpE